MLRIAITDDHTLFRSSLALLISDFKNMRVVLEASNGEELLENLQKTPVDILLLDLQMPVMDGFETCKKVRKLYPNILIIVLTLMKDSDAIKKIIKIGAHGYFTKNASPYELENAIWNLKNDGFYFEHGLASIIKDIQENLDFEIIDEEVNFSERELEIIKLTAQGKKPKDIANILNISIKTVNAHKQNIQHKYNTPNMIPVILYCIQQNKITLC